MPDYPTANVAKPATDQERGIWFWQHRDSDGELHQYGSHVTPFTPHWCSVHGWAFGDVCLTCVGEP